MISLSSLSISNIKEGSSYCGNTVLERLPNKVTKGRSRSQFLCKCGKCGCKFVARGDGLLTGHYKSCGRCNGVEVGMRFGRAVVLKELPKRLESNGRHARQYLLQCDCGRTFIAKTSSIKASPNLGCGQCHVPKIGEKQGRLIIVDYLYGGHKKHNLKVVTYCICNCDCGKKSVKIPIAYCSKTSMRPTLSCGCLVSEKSAERAPINLPPRRGAEHPGWKNGSTSLTKAIRTCTEYLNWVKKILERDNYTCQFSGESSSGGLHIHHIYPFAQILEDNNITTLDEARQCEELWDTDNGITLVGKWHLQGSEYESNSFHNLFGTKDFTQEDFRDWYMML